MTERSSGPGAKVSPAALGVLAGLTTVAVFALVPPFRQDPAYHQFADSRRLLGIPHALDVLSNLPLAVAGVLGLAAARARGAAFADAWERRPWTLLFAAVVATAFGSARYHWAPGDGPLVWDRLPQTVITASLLSAVLADRMAVNVARRVFAPLVAVAMGSVVLWWAGAQRGAGDLRLYGLVQWLPAVVVPLLLALNPARYTRSSDLWIAIGWFAVARLCELLDFEIYGALSISGHTIKHLAAAASVGALVRMVRGRRLVEVGGGW